MGSNPTPSASFPRTQAKCGPRSATGAAVIERQAERIEWASDVRLAEYVTEMDLGDLYTTFAKGGPMWLYLGNRDAVMALPLPARQWLVEEVERDSATEAAELARDILMARSDDVD